MVSLRITRQKERIEVNSPIASQNWWCYWRQSLATLPPLQQRLQRATYESCGWDARTGIEARQTWVPVLPCDR